MFFFNSNKNPSHIGFPNGLGSDPDSKFGVTKLVRFQTHFLMGLNPSHTAALGCTPTLEKRVGNEKRRLHY